MKVLGKKKDGIDAGVDENLQCIQERYRSMENYAKVNSQKLEKHCRRKGDIQV